MDIKVTIDLSKNTIEAIESLSNAIAGAHGPLSPDINVKVSEPKQDVDELKPAKKPAPKKDTPAKTEEPKQDAPAKAEESKPAKAPTKDDVAKALKALADKKDTSVAKTILAGFGASKLSELKESDYATVITKAKEASND